jgi:hypothetical protein
MNTKRIALTLISSAAFTLLAACGGGGGGSSGSTTSNGGSGGSTTPPVQSAQLSGKAIDGYLAGATVCFDNGQGACDTTLPTTTTDANGNYSLPDTGNLLGKTLLVTVTPSTKDLSRPSYSFPASFTLSQIVTAAGQQNISPFSTLITAQMETGLSQQQATAAVSQMLGGIDPNADYIASGNAAAVSTATAIVNTLTSLATNGVVDAATVRNAANAMVAAGTPDVTATQVAAQANKPVYAGVAASTVLANPTYSLDGYLPYFSSYNALPTQAIVQDVRQIQNGTIATTQQEYSSGTWQPVTNGKYETMYGAYEMKSDASWSAFVPVAAYRAALPVSVNGAVLSGTDPTTGISYTYEFRSADLSGQTVASAVPTNYGFSNLWQLAPLTTDTFASGTKAYLGLLSYSTDQVVLPVWIPACDNPTIVNGQTCDGAQPAVQEDGVVSLITGDPTVTYTSVNQAVGLSLQGRAGGFGMQLTADNKVTATTYGSAGTSTVTIGSWAVYARNANVIVLTIDPSQLAQLGTDPLLSPINDGAQLVVALRNGHLRMGWLYSSTYAQKTYQFAGSLNAQLLQDVQTAVAPQ